MGSLSIGVTFLCIIVICESLPVDKTEVDNDNKVNKHNIFFNEFVNKTGLNIARRTKRSGIISGSLCPAGTVKLYGTRECVPCNGYVYIINPLASPYLGGLSILSY